MVYQRFMTNEDGAVTVDWVVVLGALVGLGVAVSETSTAALSSHSANIEGELQVGQFETAWDANLQLQPNADTNTGGSTTGGSGTNPNPDPDPTPDPDPDPTPDPDPDPDPTPDPDPDPDPTPDPDPDPDPTPDPDPDPDPDPQPVGADGCPTPALDGTAGFGTGIGMWSPDRYSVSAGGSTQLSACGSHGFPSTVGYFDARPTMSFNLSDLDGYNRVEIETRGSGGCDTVLMVRDAQGNWYHNDDGGSGTYSRVNISPVALATGRVDVWVGTYGADQCNTTLEMETW